MISSGSGRTVYDGEATLQPAFLGELFAKAKNNQIHTCLETSDFVNNIDRFKLLPYHTIRVHK